MTARHDIVGRTGGRWPGRACRPTEERGFTIIELVVAITIFAILLGAVAYSSGSLMGLTRRNLNRSVAANLASQEIDRVRKVVTADPDIVQGTTTTSESVGGVAYRVKTSLSYTAANGTTSLCAGSEQGTATKVIAVNVRVEWLPYGERDFAAATTEIAPAPGANGSATRGAIPVTVHDASGGALQNAQVTVTDGTGASVSLSTDQKGCAYFLMEPGSYTVTAQRTGYVDRNDNASPTKGFALPAAGSMPQQFELAQAGYLDVSYDDPPPRGGEVPTGIPFSLAYWRYAAPGYLPFASAGTSTTVGPLFPDGHQVWAGDCVDADPAWWGYQRPGQLAVTPGATTPAPIDLASLDVMVVDSTGVPVPGASVSVTHDDATSACDSALGSTPTYTFSATDVSGARRVALPFGNWRVEVSNGASSASGTVTLDPSALDDSVQPFPPTITVTLP